MAGNITLRDKSNREDQPNSSNLVAIGVRQSINYKSLDLYFKSKNAKINTREYVTIGCGFNTSLAQRADS
ncbi:hypothetical protein ACTXT7_014687 [Hymenolepis weldensis]